VPSPAFTPPIWGATIFSVAPSFSSAFFSAPSSVASTPSVIRAPTLRPWKLSGGLRRMLSAGDAFRSV